MSKKEYETIYILRPDLTDEGTKKVNDKLTELVTRYEGEVVGLRDLGKKQLAYRIEKHLRGHYFQLNYKGAGQVVNELERQLRVSEEVIRFLTVKSEGLPPPPPVAVAAIPTSAPVIEEVPHG